MYVYIYIYTHLFYPPLSLCIILALHLFAETFIEDAIADMYFPLDFISFSSHLFAKKKAVSLTDSL